MKELYFRHQFDMFTVEVGCGGYAYELITLKRSHGRKLELSDYREVANAARSITRYRLGSGIKLTDDDYYVSQDEFINIFQNANAEE